MAGEGKRDREDRVRSAVLTLRHAYVLTPSQQLRIVYANTWSGNLCLEYVADDARRQPTIRYAIAEKGSKYLEYDLDREDIEDRCNASGLDVTDVAEATR